MDAELRIAPADARQKELLREAELITGSGAWDWCYGSESVFVTDGLLKLLELEPAAGNEIPLAALLARLHPADAEKASKFTTDGIQGNEASVFLSIPDRNGLPLNLDCHCRCSRDSKGGVARLWGVCRIREDNREKDAELMRKTAALLRAEQMAGIGSYHINLSKGLSHFSDNLYRIFELEPGPASADIFNCLVHPEDKANILAKYEELLKNPGEHTHDFRILTKEGGVKYLHAQGKLFIDTNGDHILEGTTLDVTSWRLMDDRLERQNDMLQQAEETAQLGSWKYNFTTKEAYFSDNLFTLLGYDERPQTSDTKKIFEHVFPEDVPGIYATYEQTIADGRQRKANFRVRGRKGETRYFTSSGKMSANRQGQPVIVGAIQDITEQHLLKIRLEEQNDFVQKLVDSSVNCVLVLDREKRYLLWNRRCQELYGFSKEEVAGKTVREVFKGFDVTWFEEAVDRALAGDEVSMEWPSTITGKYFEIHLIPLKDLSGTITQVFILIHDISALKELNEDLRTQKDFAEAIIDHTEACIFAFDREFRIRSWNRKCEQHYHKTKEEVIGRSLAALFPDKDLSIPLSRLERVLEGESMHFHGEPSFVIDRYYDSHLVPLKNSEGAVETILCLLNDVTEIHQITQRVKEANRLLEQKNRELAERTYFLETVLDTSVDYIGAYDKDLKVLEINKQSLQRYGLKKEEIVGRNICEVLPGLQNAPQLQQLKTALEGQEIHDYEFTMLRGEKILRSSMVPLKDEQDAIIGVLTIGHDITEIRQAISSLEELNHTLAAKNHELNRINAELASFSYVASHDLQEPLRKIQAFISLIMTRDLGNISESGQDYFRRIQASANRMQQMIDGLLSFSRTNTTPKVFEERHLKDILQTVSFSLQHHINEAGARIEIQNPEPVYIIPHQFEQLMEQVVGNAIKFRKKDSQPVVQIVCDRLPGQDIKGEVAQRDRIYQRISVRDNGIGFEMEQSEKIFEMFHRLNGKSEYEGTGIGLAVCRRIAQNHNGFITTESVPGEGSVFHIYIPERQGNTDRET